MTRNIDLEKLEYYAPEVLLACRAALLWLEKSEHAAGPDSDDSMTSTVVADVRFAIEKLEEAGVTLPITEDYAYTEEELEALENEASENEASYKPDPEEMAELLEAVAQSEAEEAQGIYYTTEQVRAELRELRESLASQQPQLSKIKANV